MEELKATQVLRVATRDFATSVYYDSNGELQGLEYDLIHSFAASAGLRVELVIKENLAAVITELHSGQVDLAAASLTHTKARKKHFVLPRPYEEIHETLVCNSKVNVDKIGELALVSIQVESGSSYIETLAELKIEHPQIKWAAVPQSSEEILKRIDDHEVECTLIDSNLFQIFRRYYPSAKKQFDLKEKKQLGWMIPENKAFLKQPINRWIDRITVSGELKRLLDKHYGFSDRFDPYDLQKYRERIETRLPEFRPLFEEAAKKYRFDWKLLAAVSYQESHWDPAATSPTGVKGLMMLTQKTAKAMGVANRQDPKESIFGGAKYLRSRMQRLPRFIPASEKPWFALAAYNIGYGHLTDARALAVHLHLNPNRWLDVRTALPKLTNPRLNRMTQFGYARGVEPVLYVKRIRDYYDILQKEL